MPDFRAIARRYRDSVEFIVSNVVDAKAALKAAREEANNVFDYKPGDTGDPPQVAIKLMEEKEEKEDKDK